jgi:DNA-binding beta-propeller fold protein YncE
MGGEVNGMRALVLMAAAVFMVAGCGSLTPVATGGYKLYAAASMSTLMQVAVIDSNSHAIERKLQLGTPSNDWKHLYSVISSSLIDTNPENGATLRTLQLPRHYELPKATISGVPGGMSQNGRWLALQAFDRTGSTPTATHFLLVDTSFGSNPVPIDLKGWFEFDAISNDGQNLFLIQYVAPQQYHVRLYHVAQHDLDPNFVVEKGASQTSTMAGIKLMSVASRDGEWLYTLYARENEGAFIHGLQLNGGPFAACIDLPGEGYSKDPDQFRWSLAINPNGQVLYAANGAMGAVSEIAIGGNAWPTVRATSKIGGGASAHSSLVPNVQAKEFASNAAIVTPDGKTLITAGVTGIVFLDTNSLATRNRALDGWHIRSIGLTPDGRTLYAFNDGGEIAEVAVGSAKVGAKFDPSAGSPIALMRVAAP